MHRTRSRPTKTQTQGNLQPTADVAASIVDSSANRNLESAIIPTTDVAGKAALCPTILDLGRTGDVVSGCEENGQAEVRRCDEFIAPSLCASSATRVCKEADPCR